MVKSLIADYRKDQPGKTVPDLVFRAVRPRPLLLIHVVKPILKGPDAHTQVPDLLALGLSFRDFDDSDVAKQVEYRINLVELRSGEEAEDEDDLDVEGEDDELD